MTVNSSFVPQSYAEQNVSTNYSSLSFHMYCLRSEPSSFIYTTFTILRIIITLPLSIFILHLGLQQWKQKRSTSSGAFVSHSDFFTYHAVIMELVGTVGHIICFVGICDDRVILFTFGTSLGYVVWYGEMYVNVLTCVDRYLAVVYPIAYLSHRNKIGIKIRNIIGCCVWLFALLGTCLMVVEGAEAIFAICSLTLALITVFFCSLSMLFTLTQPSPGEKGKTKRIDPSKKRAFNTILAILIVLLSRFCYSAVWLRVYFDEVTDQCQIIAYSSLLNLPSGLVLPLLFIHRAGKLMCCEESGFIKK